MKPITINDMDMGAIVLTVVMPYADFVAKFGPRHCDHPPDWDAPGPVELWFFQLPWGLKITLEYHLSISDFNIYTERLELDAVMEYLDLGGQTCYRHHATIAQLQSDHPLFTQDLHPFNLYRLDDNGNTALMHTYESQRVANYYQQVYEARGHKQLYWVEAAN